MTPDFSSILNNPRKFFIGGAWRSPTASTTFNLISPTTEQRFLTVAEAQAADVDAAVGAARLAFDTSPWSRLTPAERAVYLRRIGDAMAKREASFAAIWSAGTGLVHALSKVLTPVAAQAFQDYATLADTYRFIERHTPSFGEPVGLLVREPVGVVAAIVPWNAPLSLIAYKTAPALLAGCTVVVKASPEAPADALLLAEAVEEAGLPPGVVNVVTADREVSERLVRDTRIDKVTFTGSTAAGKRIAAICSERVARVSLELGGKNAALVLDDFDIETAAKTFAMTALYLSGQACGAITRVLVSRHRHDVMVEALSGVFNGLVVGDPFAAATQVGPLITARQRERVEGYIKRGIGEGAVLAAGGGRPSHLDSGFYVQPTVFGGATNDMVIAREEIFGPVIAVIPVDGEADAVRIANDSDFGLNASIYTPDADRFLRLARQIRSGTVGHNGVRGDFAIGWGGFKQSGIGREGGAGGLAPYLESKTLLMMSEPNLNAGAGR